jgi:hypothetical protein
MSASEFTPSPSAALSGVERVRVNSSRGAGVGRGGLLAGAAGTAPSRLEALQLVAPDEDLPLRLVGRNATSLDIASDRHYADAEFRSGLLDSQQLALSHALNSRVSDYQDNTYFSCSNHTTGIYFKYGFLE